MPPAGKAFYSKSQDMRISLVILTMLASFPLVAQQRYTDMLQRSVEGQGKITLYQSEKITALVNGTSHPKASATAGKRVTQPIQPTVTHRPDTVDTAVVPVRHMGQKMRVNGYRIQVYSGDNSRKGKMEAMAMGQRVRGMFPELPVYTHFVSPHWICRVGDFRTYEEANEYFRQMKESGQYAEAVMVRCKVIVYIEP